MTTFIDPDRERYKLMLGLDQTQPVHMINLLRFRERAAYRPDDDETLQGLADVSGREAYARYSQASAPFFAAVGGVQVWLGRPEFMLIGPEDKHWDLVFIAAYPTGQAFIDMIRTPDYQAATRHRTAALLDSRLLRCAPMVPGKGFGEG